MKKEFEAIVIDKSYVGFGEFLVTDKNYLDKKPIWILVLSGQEEGEKYRILEIKKKNNKVIYETDDTSFIKKGDKIKFIFEE